MAKKCLLLLAAFVFAACDYFNLSLSGFIEDATGTARAVEYIMDTNHYRMSNDIIAIPPNEQTVISIPIRNLQNYSLQLDLEGTGSEKASVELSQNNLAATLTINNPVRLEEFILRLTVTGNGRPMSVYDLPKMQARFLNADLAELSVLSQTLDRVFDPSITSYTVYVPYGTASIDIIAALPDGVFSSCTINGAAYDGVSSTVSVFQGMEIPIVVTSDSGTQKTYTLTVNIGLSPSKEITGFTFNIPGEDININEDEKTINAAVPHDIDITNLTPTVTHTGASYSPLGAQNFNSPVIYTVTARDGSTETYTVTVSQKQRQMDLTINAPGTKIYGDDPFTLITTGGSGEGALSFNIVDGDDIISINENMVTIHKAGSVTVTATKDGDDVYLPITSPEITITINPKALTIAGVTAVDRAYDGTTTVDLSGGSLEGVVGSDNVDFTRLGSGTVADSNAGEDKIVTTNIQLTGADMGNYTLTQPVGITVNITRAAGAAVSAPARQSRTQNSITINAVTAWTGQEVEYAISKNNSPEDLTWTVDKLVFDNLDEGTDYYIFARSKANDNYFAGEPNMAQISTAHSGDVEIVFYWVDDNDDISISASSAAVSTEGHLLITSQGSGYSEQRWFINGVEDTRRAGESSYIFYGAGREPDRDYSVVLLVRKDNKYYSANLTITVVTP